MSLFDFRTNLIGEVHHALLDRRLEQFFFGMEVKIDSAFGDLCFLSNPIDRYPLKSMASNHTTYRFEDFTDTKVPD